MTLVLGLIPQDRWATFSSVRTTVAMNALEEPHFQTAEAAREWLERIRWPKGTICPHCGTFDHAYAIRKVGWYRCAEKACRKDFSVTVGTVMERSHIALNEWLTAFYLVCSSKKRISAHQLSRALDLDYKSAWFLAHRIRRAMREAGLTGRSRRQDR
jgi:transposase-like protein